MVNGPPRLLPAIQALIRSDEEAPDLDVIADAIDALRARIVAQSQTPNGLCAISEQHLRRAVALLETALTDVRVGSIWQTEAAAKHWVG